jgi:hypothetical protein
MKSGALAPTRSRTRQRSATRTLWTSQDDALILQLLQQTSDWDQISLSFPGRSGRQLFAHWTKVLNPALVRGSWTGDEDARIVDWVGDRKSVV